MSVPEILRALNAHLDSSFSLYGSPGARISLLQSIGRFFGYLLSLWVLCVGLISAGLDTHKQGWHDKLAHNYVLRRQRY